MKKLITLLILSVIVMSCVDKTIEPDRGQKAMLSPASEEESTEVRDQVLAEMQVYFPALYERCQNRAVSLSYFYITTERLQTVFPELECEGNDTLGCIVNFSNNNGFAFYSYAAGVMGMTDEGYITYEIERPINITNLTDKASTRVYCMTALEMFLRGIVIINRRPKISFKPTGTPALTITKQPLLSSRFHTEWPYNVHCAIGNDTMSAGSTAIAVAQLFAYYGKPYKLKNKMLCDWSTWLAADNAFQVNNQYSYNINSLALAIKEIADECGTNYGAEYSWAEIDSAAKCISRYADYTSLRVVNIDDDNDIERIAINYLNRKKPLIISATSDSSADLKCTWIIDGMAVKQQAREKLVDGTTVSTDTVSTTMLHCNWGVKRYGNGYYSPALFYPNKFYFNDLRPDSPDQGGEDLRQFTIDTKSIEYNLNPLHYE